jgi:putative photosynthetic complex assembly protein
VLDASGTKLYDTVSPGTNGFLRGTMRGLARERKREGVSPELPFLMIGRSDGKLTLEDPGTGRRVDVGSFGPTNAAVFAAIMARHEYTPLASRP